ncbi:band 7 protein AGAP004871-like [Mya arenaria]|uniref:band 7 protein AGAP004871-like n=1 Tax=Mya arenaria TaxID=6604 RepID=UPI0022DF561D|nr:band 7 protein AGAP004871-like [Mya arenaria]XP_052789229.1 band 7 protein AGAP004871-like [Mya arenaria]XP_052789230.1 band 7 protein AGAP004871-like [Mya arenaria]
MSEKVVDVETAMEETHEEGKPLTAPEERVIAAGPSDIDPPAAKMTAGVPDEDESNACAGLLQVFSIIFIILFFPFSLLCALKMVQEYERAVIFRLGRILHGGAKGPGLFFVYPCMDDVVKVDIRTRSFDINPQEILTQDHVTVTVDAVMYFRVVDPVLSVTRVEDFIGSSKMLGATTLRNILGTYKMTELLMQRDDINMKMKVLLDEATDPWGVDVERVEITDVRLPDMLQRAMAAEAEATREAKAKVIAAEGEKNASRALKEAADIMSESPTALQLRYLQTLNTIAAEKNSTIVFPLPLDLLQAFKAPAPRQLHAPVHAPVQSSQATEDCAE